MTMHAIMRIIAVAAFALLVVGSGGASAQCAAGLPAEGAAVPGPLPVFPADNWWNADISAAPVDPGSAQYIAFINNGGARHLHPDFGGEAEPGGSAIYGIPYVIVNGNTPKAAVEFGYADESDGVDHTTGNALPFYPIPAEAITTAHWIEGGAPGNVDQRGDADRHLIVIDCAARALYELYNVYYDTAHVRWLAGSGAFFDMNANVRRPDGWTSADAAGLAIFPGLVRYDEAGDPAVAEIGHALRVTVRATHGYVFPASHSAGGTVGALPMGARLRLRASVGGVDPAARTTDPVARRIFRAMQKHGLIVADNGSDMYVTGTFDTRWDNDTLNPAFAALDASDFEVVQLGWKPSQDPSTATVVEYRYAAWDHYFMTAIADEIAALDSGALPGWARTGRTFGAWALGSTGRSAVCRFFSVAFAPKSSHFYTAIGDECTALTGSAVWQFEGQVFDVALPAADGGCASGTRPLYRLYNNGQGGAPNHRYTTDTDVRAHMIGAGWIPEGYGALGVNACVPG